MAALLQGQAEGNFPLSCPEELDSVLVQTWGASHVHVQRGSEESGAPCSILVASYFPSTPSPSLVLRAVASAALFTCPWVPVLSPFPDCLRGLPGYVPGGCCWQGGRWCSQVWLAGLPRPGSLCQGHVLENTFVVVLYLENFL